MGIKDLWPLLNPYCVRKPLYDLQGKTVAIDLAGWICESLCVVDYEVHARFYLRNLFFRTCYLLLSGITPVFVLEGTAPELKHQMIAKRNQIQFRGARPRKNTPTDDTQEQPSQAATTKANTQKQNKGRTRFNYVLKQCEELIRSMGLQCVQGPGEAEAFCAHLNANGLVDGVISQDSDCFAYGARRVFRNFSLSMQGTAGSIGGSIDIYDLDIVQKSMDFGRNKIIVMALLCGCDYCPEGVGGVGRDAVQKLFSMYTEADILDRIQQWRKNDNKFTELEVKVDDKTLCVNCGHNGRVQGHAKSGCGQCRMSVGCDSSIWKEKRLALKSELQIRKKAMVNAEFPSKEIIDEFMQVPIDMTALQLGWFQPNLVKFVKMMGKLIQWDEIYCFQKFLPLLTRWQLFHMGDDGTVINHTLRGSVQPDFIKKKRAPKGVPSVEIIWKDEQGCFDCLIPNEQLKTYYATHKEKSETEALQMLWSTIEPVDLVEKAYPDLIRQFEESKAKGKAKKSKKAAQGAVAATTAAATTSTETTKAKKTKNHRVLSSVDINTIDDKTIESSENAATPKKGGRRTKQTGKQSARTGAATNAKKKAPNNIQPIDRFFRKENATSSYASPKIKTTAKPMNLSTFSMCLGDSFELMHDDDMNLSEIINEMVARPPNLTEYRGKKLQYDELVTSLRSECAIDHMVNDENESSAVVTTAAVADDDNKTTPNDHSFDEFDLIVMRKARKSLIARKAAVSSPNPPDNRCVSDCSTPVMSKRLCTRLSASFKLNADLDSPLLYTDGDTENQRNSTISTSFFAIHPSDEVDLFEKSIDFRNMCDDIDDGEGDDSGNDDDDDDESTMTHSDSKSEIESSKSNKSLHTSSNDNDDCGFDGYDTFDRLVGID